jgi:hypothetical protein
MNVLQVLDCFEFDDIVSVLLPLFLVHVV